MTLQQLRDNDGDDSKEGGDMDHECISHVACDVGDGGIDAGGGDDHTAFHVELIATCQIIAHELV